MNHLGLRLLASAFGMLSCFFWLGCSQANLSMRSSTDSVEIFDGLITEDSIDKFLTKIGSRHITKIIVNSPGGEPIAAMRLGRWMFDNNVSVQVEKTCLSSCANYLFAAGAKKIIVAPGIVAWHGGAEQKNFRERDQLFSGIEQRLAKGEEISGREAALIASPKEVADYKYSQKSRPLQREFYATLKVSEYLTRAGQEPQNLRKLWALGREDLKAFGVCNVELPAGYASPDYLKRVSENFGFSIIALNMNAQVSAMLDSERAKVGYMINSCQ